MRLPSPSETKGAFPISLQRSLLFWKNPTIWVAYYPLFVSMPQRGGRKELYSKLRKRQQREDGYNRIGYTNGSPLEPLPFTDRESVGQGVEKRPQPTERPI